MALTDLYNKNLQQYKSTATTRPITDYFAKAGATGAHTLNVAGVRPGLYGLSSLENMLMNEGRMDPRIMAQQQGQISRDTRSAQTGAQGMLAQKGFGQSGLGAALQGAIGQAGVNAQADNRYRNEADAYGRQQQNLGLLRDLVMGPQIDYSAMALGQYGVQSQNKANKDAATMAMIAQLIGAFV